MCLGTFMKSMGLQCTLANHRYKKLYSLYLEPQNFSSIALPLYVNACSSNSLVRSRIAYQLRHAAEQELLKQAPVIDIEGLYRGSAAAFAALSTLLGDEEYFFHASQPTLFDASVFAYTHLLLDSELGWRNRRMAEGLEQCPNLVQHRERILQNYFGDVT